MPRIPTTYHILQDAAQAIGDGDLTMLSQAATQQSAVQEYLNVYAATLSAEV